METLSWLMPPLFLISFIFLGIANRTEIALCRPFSAACSSSYLAVGSNLLIAISGFSCFKNIPKLFIIFSAGAVVISAIFIFVAFDEEYGESYARGFGWQISTAILACVGSILGCIYVYQTM